MTDASSDIEYLLARLEISAYALAALLGVTERSLRASAEKRGPDVQGKRRIVVSKLSALRAAVAAAESFDMSGRIVLSLLSEPAGDGDERSLIGRIVDDDATSEEVKELVREAISRW